MRGSSHALHLSLLFAALLAPVSVRAAADEDALKNAVFLRGHAPVQPVIRITVQDRRNVPVLTGRRDFPKDDCSDGPNPCFGMDNGPKGDKRYGWVVRRPF